MTIYEGPDPKAAPAPKPVKPKPVKPKPVKPVAEGED